MIDGYKVPQGATVVDDAKLKQEIMEQLRRREKSGVGLSLVALPRRSADITAPWSKIRHTAVIPAKTGINFADSRRKPALGPSASALARALTCQGQQRRQ